MTADQGQHISELAIPPDAKRVDFRSYDRRKAYAYGWWRRERCGNEMMDVINMVACFTCQADKDLVNFDIPVPGGSFPRTEEERRDQVRGRVRRGGRECSTY